MEAPQRDKLIRDFLAGICFPLLESKGASYAQTDVQPDVNSNFKRQAVVWGVTPLQAWGIYFGKHIDAIQTHIRTGGSFESEPIHLRIADAVNYLLILYSLLEEQKERATRFRSGSNVLSGDNMGGSSS